MNRYEYMKMPISILPQQVIEEDNPLEKVYKECVWIEIRRIIYGLPQSGKLANEYLRKKPEAADNDSASPESIILDSYLKRKIDPKWML